MRQDILTSREKQKAVNFVSGSHMDQRWPDSQKSRHGLKRQAVCHISGASYRILGKADMGCSSIKLGSYPLCRDGRASKEKTGTRTCKLAQNFSSPLTLSGKPPLFPPWEEIKAKQMQYTFDLIMVDWSSCLLISNTAMLNHCQLRLGKNN